MVNSQRLYVRKLAHLEFASYLILELHGPHDLHTFTSFSCSLGLGILITGRKLWALIFGLYMIICLSWEEIGKHRKYARLLFVWMAWIERVCSICTCCKVTLKIYMWNMFLLLYILSHFFRRGNLLEFCLRFPCSLDEKGFFCVICVINPVRSCFIGNLLLWLFVRSFVGWRH